MSYQTRISLAVAGSLIVHAAVFSVVGVRLLNRDIGFGPEPEPFVVNFEPRPDLEPPRFIDGGATTDEAPPEDSNLVSAENTRAQDETSGDDALQPTFEDPGEIRDVGLPAPEPTPTETPSDSPQVTEDSAPSPEIESELEIVEEAPNESPTEEAEEIESAEARLAALVNEATKDAVEEETSPSQDRPESTPAPFQVAQAPQPVTAQIPEVGAMEGPVTEGAEAQGTTSYAAAKHVLGEYMREMRRSVERAWRTSLQLKYSGTANVRAVLKCTISPNGDLVKVEIVDKGESLIYAALCKQAIERAAPFGSFPFDIPSIYRTRNLEIQWTFSLH